MAARRARPQVLRQRPSVDLPAAEHPVADLPRALGRDPASPGCGGVRAEGSRTLSPALHGALREDARTRAEFSALTGTAA